MDFFERFERMFLAIEKETGCSKHRILLEAGVDPAQFRAYTRVGRLLSVDTLTRLGKSPLVPHTVNELLSWKALAEYGPDVLTEALKVLEEERPKRKAS